MPFPTRVHRPAARALSHVMNNTTTTDTDTDPLFAKMILDDLAKMIIDALQADLNPESEG